MFCFTFGHLLSTDNYVVTRETKSSSVGAFDHVYVRVYVNWDKNLRSATKPSSESEQPSTGSDSATSPPVGRGNLKKTLIKF